MNLLPQELIGELLNAALGAGLDRKTLLGNVNPAFVAGLPTAGSPKDQLLQDLYNLNGVEQLTDGSVPLQKWLENAIMMVTPRAEVQVFSRALESLGKKPAPQQQPAVSPPRSERERDPVKILFLGTNPSDQTQRALDQEVREISDRLRSATLGDRFKLVQAWAVRVDDLQESLLNHRPTIVHFSGHGNRDGQIILQDRTGRSIAVNLSALARTFEILRDNIRCVVLNAWASQVQAEAIAQHINSVVWMAATLTDAGAIAFSGAFYQGLGFGRNLKTAFDLGCNQMMFEAQADANLPMLSCHAGIRPEEERLLEPPR